MASFAARTPPSRASAPAAAAERCAWAGSSPSAAERGVPDRPGHLLDRGQQVRQPVLDPLELPDRPAELDAGSRVLGRRLERPAGTADELGRRDDDRHVVDVGGRHAVEHPLRRDRHAVELDLGGPARRVEARPPDDGHPGRRLAVGAAQLDRAPPHRPSDQRLSIRRPSLWRTGHGHRDDGDGRQADAEDRGKRAGHRQDTARADVGGGERRRRPSEGDARRRRPVEHAGQERLLHVAAAPGEQRGGEGGRYERPGGDHPAELLGDDRQLEDAEPLTAELLGDVDADPPLLGQVGPDRRQDVVVDVEQGPRDVARAVPIGPPPERPPQLLVLLAHPDRHGPLPPRPADRARPGPDDRQRRLLLRLLLPLLQTRTCSRTCPAGGRAGGGPVAGRRPVRRGPVRRGPARAAGQTRWMTLYVLVTTGSPVAWSVQSVRTTTNVIVRPFDAFW